MLGHRRTSIVWVCAVVVLAASLVTLGVWMFGARRTSSFTPIFPPPHADDYAKRLVQSLDPFPGKANDVNVTSKAVAYQLGLWQFDTPGASGVSLSADGKYMAVYMFQGETPKLEIWQFDTRLPGAHKLWTFCLAAEYGMKWHPSRHLLVASTDDKGLWLIDSDTGKDSYITGGYPTSFYCWNGNSELLLANIKFAGEHPRSTVLVNVRNGSYKPFATPSRMGGTCVESSITGDFATERSSRVKAPSIQIYVKHPRKQSWNLEANITSLQGPSRTITVLPRLVNWLSDGRLVYAMIPRDNGENDMGNTFLWTCHKDGSDRKQWIKLSGASLPPYPTPGGQGISVSANGKRVAFFRKDKLFVYDTANLVDETERLHD